MGEALVYLRLNISNQFPDTHAQRLRNSDEGIQGNIHDAAFDLSEIFVTEVRLLRELFLA